MLFSLYDVIPQIRDPARAICVHSTFSMPLIRLKAVKDVEQFIVNCSLVIMFVTNSRGTCHVRM